MSIVVLGSINADLVLSTLHLPQPGETIRATALQTYPGGKGANQAVAVARLGVDVHLIGRVGTDGAELMRALRESGVEVSAVGVDPSAPSGTALITVAADGQNTIVTFGGANHRVGDDEIAALRALLPTASMLMIQLEIPMPVVERAVDVAASNDVAVMLDPAPVAELAPEVLREVTWLTPNEHEATILCGSSTDTPAFDLRDRGVRNVVVTLGERGCVYAGEAGGADVESPAVDAIDTVACGDAFNGALAVALTEGREVTEALRFACAAGAAAATVPGASPSLPNREAIDAVVPR